MIDDLERGGCGPVVPYEPLWQCFLSAGRKITIPVSGDAVSQINQVGMDSAKLHCCHKAVTPKCRRLCVQTFSSDWTETRGDFEFDCYSQISEMSLKQCLDEGMLLRSAGENFGGKIKNRFLQLTSHVSWDVMGYRFVPTLIIDRLNCFEVVTLKLTMRRRRTWPCGNKMLEIFGEW